MHGMRDGGGRGVRVEGKDRGEIDRKVGEILDNRQNTNF